MSTFLFFVNKKWLLIELSYFIRQIHATSHGMMNTYTQGVKAEHFDNNHQTYCLIYSTEIKIDFLQYVSRVPKICALFLN